MVPAYADPPIDHVLGRYCRKPRLVDLKLQLEEWVGRTVDVVNDRTMRTCHPRYCHFVYPIN